MSADLKALHVGRPSRLDSSSAHPSLNGSTHTFAAIMEVVARELWGEPNKALCTAAEVRFGSRGSRVVDRFKGVWHDHEAGDGGGVLDLVMREKRTDKAGAMAYLHEHGHLEAAPVRKARIVKTYDYTNERGELLFHVCRYDPKDFKQRAPDGTWKTQGIRKVLYRLPDVLRAVEEGETVYVVEGEKSADALRQLGRVATCSPGGANKWTAEHSKTLTGARVVVLADNDEPGARHAKLVTDLTKAVAQQIQTLFSLPHLPEKGDVFDFFKAGGTLAELDAMTANVRPGEKAPTCEMPPELGIERSTFGRLRLVYVEDLLNAPARTYLLDGLMSHGELSVWWGKPKCGKSFLMLRLAYGLALGEGMWGRAAEKVPVLYVAAEGQTGIATRVVALRETLGNAPDFVMLTQSVNLFAADADLSDLIAATRHIGGKLVVLDTLARTLTGGNENSSQDMSIYIENCARIQQETGAHVAIIHHGGWEGAHSRGSTALPGGVNISLRVEGESGTSHAVTVEFAKDDPAGDRFGFTLDPVELRPDALGRPRTTLIAVAADAPADDAQSTARLNEEAVTLLRHVHNAFAKGEGGMMRPEPDMPLCQTISRHRLKEVLASAGWFDIPDVCPAFPDQMGKISTPESKRLHKRLTTLQIKGIIGFNRNDVWLTKPLKTEPFPGVSPAFSDAAGKGVSHFPVSPHPLRVGNGEMGKRPGEPISDY